jgi:hypothetical protein
MSYSPALELRDAVGAHWPFLCDFEREVIKLLEIVKVTDKRYGPVAIPYIFVPEGHLTIDQIYNGWWYVGRRLSRSCATISEGSWPTPPIGPTPTIGTMRYRRRLRKILSC